MVDHQSLVPGTIHVPQQWEFADAAARISASITDASQVGKLALQLDDGSYWRLLSIAPVTWTTTAPMTPSIMGPAILAWFNTLPTVLPASTGVLWNNGGTLAQS